jgi:hypothetical protein
MSGSIGIWNQTILVAVAREEGEEKQGKRLRFGSGDAEEVSGFIFIMTGCLLPVTVLT